MRYVDQLNDIVADYLFTSGERIKRGILDFGGGNLKFLFGNLTQSDANKYTQHIQKLESEQSFLRISKEQMIVLKSAITSFNIITTQKVTGMRKY